MTSFRNKLSLSGLFTAAAVAVTSLMGSFSAEAHLPKSHELSLKQYEDFVMKMQTPSGSSRCCDYQDAMVGMEEEIRTDEKGFPHYWVKMTNELDGSGQWPEEGQWIRIPDMSVLNGVMAEKTCAPLREKNPDSTCNAPPENVLWKRPGVNGTLYCYWPKPQGY